MKLSEIIEQVGSLTCSQSTKKCYRYRLTFCIRYGGDAEIELIDAEHITCIRGNALAAGKSVNTIENSIKDVRLLLARFGHEIPTGQPLRRPAPQPNPATLEQVNAACEHSPPWLRAFLSLAYVTGLRRGDLMRLDLSTVGESVTVQASKTGKVQRFPVPEWCQRSVEIASKSATTATSATSSSFPADPHTVYRNIRNACKSANVDYFTPQQVRILSARTWERLQPGLGPLILGHSLPGWSSATQYYLDPWEALFDRVHDFPPLDSLLTLEERCQRNSARQRLHRLIERLDERGRKTLTAVAEGLAG